MPRILNLKCYRINQHDDSIKSTFLSSSLFAETRDIAASPLKASQAYKNIVDGLRTAKVTAMTAKEIIEEVHGKVRNDRYVIFLNPKVLRGTFLIFLDQIKFCRLKPICIEKSLFIFYGIYYIIKFVL